MEGLRIMRGCRSIASVRRMSITAILLFSAAILAILPAKLEAQRDAATLLGEAPIISKNPQDIAGRLNSGGAKDSIIDFQGDLDAQSKKLLMAPDKSPFAPSAANGEERWSGDFSPVGSDGNVYAIAIDASGHVYAGGDFTTAGGVTANYIARWNGHNWSAVGSGLDGPARALAMDWRGNLYAGGEVATASGSQKSYVAMWNGSEWTALGSGIWADLEGHGSYVTSLSIDREGVIYVGGYYSKSDHVIVDSIAKWDGVGWSIIGSGINGIVRSLAVDWNGNLYAGGHFTIVNGVPVNRIAKWNGDAWSALGSGVNNNITGLTVDRRGNLFAAGDFTSAGEVGAKRIAQWDGYGWSALGSGISDRQPLSSFALAVDANGDLYVGGCFKKAGGVAVKNVARWDGTAWSALGSGAGTDANASIYAIAMDGRGNLYSGGRFDKAGGAVTRNIAKWNRNSWSALGGNGLSSYYNSAFARVLVTDGSGNLYAGGKFEGAGGVAAKNIAKWNGSSWSALGSGIDEYAIIRALAVDGFGNLYVGGTFFPAPGRSVDSVIKWDGRSWSALGTGMNGDILALAVDGSGNLYAGGLFTTAGGATVGSAAKWDGSTWSALGPGVFGSVNALAVDGRGNLYAGGWFSIASGLESNALLKWDGSSWSSLGAGVRGRLSALAVDRNGNLYAGGLFFREDEGNYKDGVIKWNGSKWSVLGLGSRIIVESLVTDDSGNIYAAGQFDAPDGSRVYSTAKWTGSSWAVLGSGMNSSVQALAVDGSGSLYVGGGFTTVGSKSSSCIAKWNGRPAVAVDFNSLGIFLWNGEWRQISDQHPRVIDTWGNRLVASFPGSGLYLHDGSAWTKLGSLKSTERAMGIAHSLYIDAGDRGIYRYKQGWSRIHTSNPTMMANYGEKLAADFPDAGVWIFDGRTWKRISPWTTAKRMLGVGGRLFVDFGSSGLFRYDGSWIRTTTHNPKLIHAFGTALVASFDSKSARGIYLYRNNSWRKISPNPSVEGFASTSSTLYADRGSQGISKYEKGAWTTISRHDPDSIAIFGDNPVAAFPDRSLRLYSEEGWRYLATGLEVGKLQRVFFE